MLPDNTIPYTNAQLRDLISHLKKEFIDQPIMLNCQGEPCDKFPRRWVAERFPMSVKLTVDGRKGKAIFIELPDPNHKDS